MMPHTPGPWHVWGEDDWWESQTDDLVVVADVGDMFVCNMGPPVSPLEADTAKSPNLANARLIAAAPEMLEALELACETLRAQEWEINIGVVARVEEVLEKVKGTTV